MKIWRISIRPTSLQLTPWQADTLFGTLCWALRHRQGEEGLIRFLEPFLDRDPPFLLSDGMPSGYLPLPFHLRIEKRAEVADVEAYRKEKALKKVSYLPEEVFRSVCRGEPVEIEEANRELVCKKSQMHASINRITGTTTRMDDEEGGSLFELMGEVPGAAGKLDIYVAERVDGMRDTLLGLLKDVELSGFGKKKSSGMGAFRIEGDFEPWRPPDISAAASGFVSLSGFVPGRSDPTTGFWQLKVKHGKLGEDYAVGGSPFKTPWIVLDPGTCLVTQDASREVYGRMLRNLTDRDERVVQYGYAFPVPMVISHDTLVRVQ